MTRKLEKSLALFERGKELIPGCAQTFSKGYTQYVQGVAPIYLERGKGSYVWDVDGNRYIDFVQGLLPNILGYANDEVNAAVSAQIANGHSFSLPHPLEIEVAEKLVQIIPSAEMVRFGKNGSDATAGAVRVARAFTGRDMIACCGYHGWQDWFIGSTARNLGVPKAVAELCRPFVYNDLESLDRILSQFPGQFAAVIMEPMNYVEPKPGFLAGVRDLAHKHGALLIFDEICSGWHFGLGGAQKYFDITPDLSAFGKAMGNGFPISAIVGRREIMRKFEDIFVSFTFAGETSSLAAAKKVIEILEREPVIATLARRGAALQNGINATSEKLGIGKNVYCIGKPQWSLIKFCDNSGKDSLAIKSLFQQELLKRGILSLGSHNLNYTLSDADVTHTLKSYEEALAIVAAGIQAEDIPKRLEGSMIQAIFKVR